MSRVTRKIVRNAKQWEALSNAEKAARRRAIEALSIMHDEGIPLTPAAKRVRASPRTAMKYIGPATKRDRRGRIVAKSTDRLFRRMSALTTRGVKEVDTTNSREASDVGGHWNAVGHGLGTGNWNKLTAFKGKKVGGYTLETDPDIIEQQAQRGDLDFEDIYDLTQ